MKNIKQIVGYLVEKDNEIIGATGNEREAMLIARNWKGISYKVVTTIDPEAGPITDQTVAYDGTI